MQSFLEEYGSRTSNSVVRVHRDIIEDGSTRHHGIWIDTVHLVQSEVFRSRFERYLTEIKTDPIIIVNPGHDAGREMAALATAFWARKGVDIACYEHPSLSSATHQRGVNPALFDIIAKANARQSILILDDAFITGRRLAAYQTHLRNQSFRGRVYYGVAIARPKSLAAWEQFARRLEYRGGRAGRKLARNVVRAIETLVIPNWNEDDCPWCKEVRLHGDAFTVEQSRIQQAREDRLGVLEREKELGLKEGLYLQVSERRPWEIAGESIFAPAGACEAAVFVAVASALQDLRTVDDEAGRRFLALEDFPGPLCWNTKSTWCIRIRRR